MNTHDWGTVALAFIAALSAGAVVTGLLAHFRRNDRLTEVTIRLVVGVFLLVVFATGLLVHAFLTDQFSVMYVAYNSSRAQPLFYKLSAFWGSLDGSVLLWELMLTGFSAACMLVHQRKDRELVALTGSILMIVSAFFAILLLVTTNPFKSLDFLPPDGLGLNPLLQNPSMVVHPPSLYLGFVGFTIPFAFAIAALISNRLDSRWIVATRNWTMLAWVFLTLGNLLGANWAYVELGWGGYWGWDPVENAAIMPWFTGTAFLHSIMIQEKRNMLRVWNVGLILATFWLTIFGTFLTRSGVVSSIHAFSESNVGSVFVAFMAVGMTATVALVVWRWDSLKSPNRIESVLSRESAFLYNNVVFVGIMFAVLWGTSYPIVLEAFSGDKISVGAPLFNKLVAPFAMAALFLAGFGPIVSWRQMTQANFRRNILPPSIVMFVAVGAAAVLGVLKPYALITIGFSVFCLVAIGTEFGRAVAARKARWNENYLLGFWSIVRKNPRRYLGYIIHIGAVMIFIAIAGNLYGEQKSIVMSPGESTEFAGFTLTYNEYRSLKKENYRSDMAIFEVKGPLIGTMTMFPEKRSYDRKEGETSTEVAIWSSPIEDLYLILADRVDSRGRASFRFLVNPLVQWMWLGGAVMAAGGLLSLFLTWMGRSRAPEKTS